MARIAFIGAGSAVFTRKLVCDLVTFEELAGSEIVLMDIDAERLHRVTQIAEHIIDQQAAKLTVRSTMSRRDALRDADYVVLTVAVGRIEARELDVGIPERYGVGQCVGDTIGPGGIFRGLRHLVIVDELIEDIGELCPDALVLQYSNPMAILTWRLAESPIKAVGLCHSVQGTSRLLAGFCGVPADEIDYWVAGINHQAWFLQLQHKATDLLPVLKQQLADPERYAVDPVRVELFRHFGYFVTESSAHASEYLPYFRKTPEMIDEWATEYVPPGAQYGGGATGGSIATARKREADYDAMLRRQASGQERFEVTRSHEYGIAIINAMETGTPIRINGNVQNSGLITNLPAGCCVEVPCLVDGLGIHPCVVGDLPGQLAALNRSNIGLQEMVLKAHAEKDRDYVYQAMALDPLTATVCTLNQINRMTDEMLAANNQWINL